MALAPIRILHTADWHLGVRLQHHSREREQIERLREMVEIAIERKVHVFLVAGDLYYEKNRVRESAKITERMINALLPLAQHGIPIVMIPGNHDHVELFEQMEALTRISAAFVGATSGAPHASRTPLVVVKDADVVRVSGVQFVCLPYPTRELMAFSKGYNPEEHDGQDPRIARNEATADAVLAKLQELVKGSKFSPNLPSVLVGHFTTTNARTPFQEEGFLQDFAGDFVIPASAIPNLFAYGAFGHIHMPQNLHDTDKSKFHFPARYAGSPCRLNMGERDDEKSVTIVEIPPDGSEARLEVVPLKQTPMQHIECTWEELDHFEKEAAKYENVYVRLYLKHDGTIPHTRMTSRAKKIFPMHVGIRLFGPQTHIISKADRQILAKTEDAILAAAEAEMWNPEDMEATVNRYLDERFEGDPELPHLKRSASILISEVDRKVHGGIDALEDLLRGDKAEEASESGGDELSEAPIAVRA